MTPEALTRHPFPSRRSSVLAANGVVATSQPLAAQAGLEMLRRGGSAVDAAIACAAALTVLEPTSNGIGSDAFALVWEGGRLHGLNASGRSPRALDVGRLRAAGSYPERGWPSVTVPGAPDSWRVLHERFGRVPIAELLAPAIAYAEEGYPVSPVVSQLWERASQIFLPSPDAALAGWKQLFAPAGRAPHAGERFTCPAMALGLRLLAERGLRDFYEGQVAEQILAWSQTTGGVLGADDMAAHVSEWVDPIGIGYRGHEVWEIPPNGQGIAALQALKILEGTEYTGREAYSDAAWHLQIEAMKLGFADAYRYVADPECAPVPGAGMLDTDYLASRRALIGERAGDPGHGEPPRGGTVYLCTADRDGMMVSFIQSNYMGFGSGVVVPEVGVSLQNRGAGFTLEEGHPNEAAGGKRPRHTIIPAFLTRDGEPLAAFGVMGGEMQPQGHLQVVCGLVDHGLNAQAVMDAPRWQVGEGRSLSLEPGTSEAMVRALAARGHQVQVAGDSLGFGRGQIVARLDSGVYAAGSEPRTDGAACGW